ncbi:hypothetical protein [Psychroserpens sp. SPM9]|uniref:DUF922 domain-containing protein n=1 Tax=Psychroserpens sp. SPM9 TaxID=2975598 RepID=UPI0021A63EA3|nr:hypothetical protein [Psychroserpens sp. SPM9]MDG5492408.1 hypothetical protein [Psychroserpens sp. SPM9]
MIFLFVLNVSSNNEVTIQWNENKKLTWADFRGAVDTTSDAVAVTASGITFSFSVQQSNDRFVSFNAQADAHFYPEKSWYIKDKGDDHILAHEQLHFDITELHVRRLRYGISKLKVSQRIREDLRALHEDANMELAKMQNAYDLQSQNSIDKEQQAIWAEFVKEELQKYSAFRSK